MKKLLGILFIFGGLNSFSQDTLFLKNGDTKAIKLTEVTPNEIKFKRSDNMDGPVYILDRREIVKVKFANGETENLGIESPKSNEPQVVKSNPAGNRYLNIKNKEVFFVSEPISDRELKKFIDEYQFAQNKPLMQEHFSKAMDFKRKRGGFMAFIPLGFVVPAVTTVIAIGTEISGSGADGGVIFVSGVVAGAALRIAGFACTKMFKNKYRAERVKIAVLYNESK